MGSKVRSGTPVEAKGAARGIGSTIGDLFGPGASIEEVLGRIASPLQRGASQASMSFLGIDPSVFGAQFNRLMMDPMNRANPMFAAMEPFEARQQATLRRGVAEALGSQGGRFGSDIAGATGTGLAQLLQGQELNRQNLVQNILGQQSQLLGQLAPSLTSAAGIGQQGVSDILGQLLGWARPGPPIVTPGIGQQLLGAAGTIAGGVLGSPFGPLGGILFPRFPNPVTGQPL